MVNAHSDVCGPSTKHIINPVVRNLFRYKDLSKEHNWVELLTDIERLINVNFSIWKTHIDMARLKRLAPQGDIVSLLENLFMEEAKANGKKHVFIKENHLYEFLSFLLINFPNAKYIYQVRDPRDMALSWKKSKIHKGGVIAGARQWKKDQINFLKDFTALQAINKGLLIKYEDLISNSEKELRRVCQFSGLKFDNNMLNYHHDDLTKVNANNNDAWSNLSKGIINNNKEKFKEELNKEEIQCIEKICYREMRVLNYTPLYSEEELESFAEEKLINLEKEELPPNRDNNSGVRKNIDAKRVFYQKLLP